MRIIHVLARMDREAAGPSYSVPGLCEHLARRDARAELHVLEPVPLSARNSRYEVRGYPGWTGFGWSPAMARGLAESAAEADILHNHGLWLPPNLHAARAAEHRACRLVVSPHGMLAPWALRRSRWKKRALWWLAQRRALEAARCLHATADSEFLDIRRAGLRAPVAVIPNGIDIPEFEPEARPDGRRRLLFLARLHPVKGLDLLLRAWQRLEPRFPDWDLAVAGPGEAGYPEAMKRLAAELRLRRVEFTGPVYGADKSRLFGASDLYVLPSHSENFGLTVAEALAHGVPAVVSHNAPWPGLRERGCGWWFELGEDSLAESLAEALGRDPAVLREMGARGRAWMAAEFCWESVAERMLGTYRWLTGGGAAPAWIRTGD
jgi:glycosyltransferase involved in cell wall biosynthesis